MRQPLDPKSPTAFVGFKAPASLLLRIDAEAQARGLNRSATVRALVVEALARRPKK